MSTQETNAKTTTYSMIVAQLLENERKGRGLKQGEFLEKARITQSSWSRINRGIGHFTLEETRSACIALGVSMDVVLANANEASEKLPEEEGVEILESLKGSENTAALPKIIAGAALGYLIIRLLSK